MKELSGHHGMGTRYLWSAAWLRMAVSPYFLYGLKRVGLNYSFWPEIVKNGGVKFSKIEKKMGYKFYTVGQNYI